MVVQTAENPSDCGSQKGKAKSRKGRIVARIARFVRKEGLSYDDWRYVSRRVRQKCDLRPAAKPKKLPRVLTADQFRALLQGGGRGGRRATCPDAAAVVLHGRQGQRAVRHRGRRR